MNATSLPAAGSLSRNVGSFRDPSGQVYLKDGRILRLVMQSAAAGYEAARDSGFLSGLVETGKLVSFKEIDVDEASGIEPRPAYVLEHQKLDFISYPYEWSFSLLKDAALFHLDIQIDAIDQGFAFSDASAYNVQFIGPNPIFIDHLSLRPYRDGEFWFGHRQFCEQFLNPLLLHSLMGVAHNSWYRGNLDGIPVEELARVLPFVKKLSWNVFSHIVLQTRFQQATTASSKVPANLRHRRLSRQAYRAMLVQMRNWIARLLPARTSASTWANYASSNTYSDKEAEKKKQFVRAFVREVEAKSVVDLGCNTGDYSVVALEAGAKRALGFDFDQQALHKAHHRAKAKKLNFLPLFLDAKNPSPDQGWLQAERSGFARRVHADCVLALAFEHHLAIAHNVPLDQIVDWIVSIAPSGIVEFVPKTDPTVQKMLELRDDIFPHYTEESFERALRRNKHVVKHERISESGRSLYAFVSE